MNELWLGIDVGSISTKAVLIDNNNNIITSKYILTEVDPIMAVKKIIAYLNQMLPSNSIIRGIGVTGSARNLIGKMLDATIVKNEITAHAIGTMTRHPDVRTILEIGGQDSKIILLENGIIVDYAMNTLCAAGTGAFLSSQAARLGVPVEEFGNYATTAKSPIKLAARCTVFAESDLVHKAQVGYKKEDIIAGLCRSVVLNYLNNVGKGKKIKEPIIFQGGVSKNKGVVKCFEEILDMPVKVDEYGHLLGAFGIAILSKKTKTNKTYSLNIENIEFKTKGYECNKCSNTCELLSFYKNKDIIDVLGSKCGNML